MAGDPVHQGNVAFVEECFARYGDTYRGMGWTKTPESAARRHDVMLDVLRPERSNHVSLLDFGCGTSQLLDRIRARNLRGIEYVGLDASERLLAVARTKFPEVRYLHANSPAEWRAVGEFDYVVASGVFTTRIGLSYDEALAYFQSTVVQLFTITRVGVAVNLMSSHVDWQRDDLFHLALDTFAAFAIANLSRQLVIRHDYGLYEYTGYIYREPSQSTRRWQRLSS
jgi:SAM-dependent methyltransferase